MTQPNHRVPVDQLKRNDWAQITTPKRKDCWARITIVVGPEMFLGVVENPSEVDEDASLHAAQKDYVAFRGCDIQDTYRRSSALAN